jgi:hypothetical protein
MRLRPTTRFTTVCGLIDHAFPKPIRIQAVGRKESAIAIQGTWNNTTTPHALRLDCQARRK